MPPKVNAFESNSQQNPLIYAPLSLGFLLSEGITYEKTSKINVTELINTLYLSVNLCKSTHIVKCNAAILTQLCY